MSYQRMETIQSDLFLENNNKNLGDSQARRRTTINGNYCTSLAKLQCTLAKQDNNNCFIRGNKLHVNNQIYSVEDLSKTEEAVQIEEKTHIHSAPGTPTPSLQNKIDDLPKLAQKPIIIECSNQRTASVSSPISIATGTIKRDRKKSAVQQKLRKDKEEKSRIETQQQSKK
ncbi:hypothetical protein JTB14_034336 [Gonioctena quinquepunctata]|nr:hypothetical protein JTB14_034336 [Gonioctena quinquepunctata]